jgi:hypothetical protein
MTPQLTEAPFSLTLPACLTYFSVCAASGGLDMSGLLELDYDLFCTGGEGGAGE